MLKEVHAGEQAWRALRLLGKLRYLFLPLFFCWHRKMSRPFTRDGETYRVCLRCGARRQFDLEQWQTKGDYYNPKEQQNHSASSHESKPRLQLVESVRHDNAQIRSVRGR